MKYNWPENKKFAFTIVDDTDSSTVANVKSIYDFLYQKGLLTTKSVWVYPSRDKFTGESLSDSNYLQFILELQGKGFEICSHNVGSGVFSRQEILEGMSMLRNLLGDYPTMHINHASNPDNIYWGNERFQPLLKSLLHLVYGKKRKYNGSSSESTCFWGDLCKTNIKYIRNRTFSGINTLKYDPKMPYREKPKDLYSNYWFSSSDGHTVEEFSDLLSKHNIDKLEAEGGACIVYTHFASGFVENGKINKTFKSGIEYLASKDGWFVPASTLLDFLLSQHNSDDYISGLYLTSLDFKWLVDRLIKKIKYKR